MALNSLTQRLMMRSLTVSTQRIRLKSRVTSLSCSALHSVNAGPGLPQLIEPGVRPLSTKSSSKIDASIENLANFPKLDKKSELTNCDDQQKSQDFSAKKKSGFGYVVCGALASMAAFAWANFKRENRESASNQVRRHLFFNT